MRDLVWRWIFKEKDKKCKKKKNRELKMVDSKYERNNEDKLNLISPLSFRHIDSTDSLCSLLPSFPTGHCF